MEHILRRLLIIIKYNQTENELIFEKNLYQTSLDGNDLFNRK